MSNTEALPPLPEPPTPAEWLHHMYSADQMRAYALAALAQPATIAEWWAAKQAASGEPVGYANSDELDNMLDDRTAVISAVQDGFRKTPLYAAPQPAASGAQADLIAGALYDLMGDLTSRDETIRLGATEWATPAADALVAFAAKRGLSLDNPAIADWSKRIAAAPQPAPARVPLTDDQILNIIDDVLEGGSLVDVARAIEAAHGIGITAKEAP